MPETANISLEPLTAAHADEMFAVLSHPDIYTYISDEPPVSATALAERYQRLESRCSPDGTERWLNWVVRHRADGRCAGYVQATIHPAGTADLSYVIAPEFWGRGLAREGCQAALDWLFSEGEVSAVFATVDRRNERSCGLLLRLGFQRVPAFSYPHGEVEEMDDVFSLAASEHRTRVVP